MVKFEAPVATASWPARTGSEGVKKEKQGFTTTKIVWAKKAKNVQYEQSIKNLQALDKTKVCQAIVQQLLWFSGANLLGQGGVGSELSERVRMEEWDILAGQ